MRTFDVLHFEAFLPMIQNTANLSVHINTTCLYVGFFLWLGILYLLGRKYDKWYTVDRNMYFSLNPICVPHRKHTRPCEYGCEELCIINRIGLNLFKLMQIYVRTYSACCLCHVAFYINIHNCHCLKTWPGKEKKSHSFCFVKAADEIETFL